MTSILDRKVRISGLEYFYMFMLLFYAGSASFVARSIGNILTIGNAFILLFTIFIVFQKRINLGKDLLLSFVIFLCYASITTFLNKMINPLWISQWLIWLFIAYVCCKNFRNRFFITYETLMFWMTLIAMFFWVVHLIIPQAFESFARSICFLQSYSSDVDNANIIFYTIQDSLYVENESSAIIRNPGFAWEPGAFSVFLCFALFCNLLRTKWRFKHNIALYVFVLALLSTRATTGITIFILCILIKCFLDKKILLGLIMLIPAAFLFINLPFLWPKMHSEILEITNFSYEDISYGSQQLGRIRSLFLAIQDFKAHPFFGLGGYSEGTILNAMGFNNVALISGIGELLSKYGSIMTAVFIFSVVYSSKVISGQFGTNNSYLLILIIIGSTFSYSLWRCPLLMTFWLYGYFCHPKLINSRLSYLKR